MDQTWFSLAGVSVHAGFPSIPISVHAGFPSIPMVGVAPLFRLAVRRLRTDVAPLFRLAVRRVRTGDLLRSCGNG